MSEDFGGIQLNSDPVINKLIDLEKALTDKRLKLEEELKKVKSLLEFTSSFKNFAATGNLDV